MAQEVKKPPERGDGLNPSVGKILLEKETATHPYSGLGTVQTEESGSHIQSMGSQGAVGHDLLTTTTAINQSQYRQGKKKEIIPVMLIGVI